MRYKSGHANVEAMQWPADPGSHFHSPSDCAEEIAAWVNANGGEARMGWEIGREWEQEHNSHIAVRTINGWAYAKPGHYVVKGEATFDNGVAGCEFRLIRDFYPCDPETFERRWEPNDA